MTAKLAIVMGLAILTSMASFMMYNNTNNNNSQEFLSSGLSLSDLKDFAHVKDLHLRLGEFKNWTAEHNKQYGKAESLLRFTNWMKNYDIVQEHNAKNLSWTLGMNLFADLTLEEFGALYLGFNFEQAKQEERNEVALEESLEYPSSIDWKSKGAVTFVRNQGQCGACWAFAAVTGLQSAYKIKTGKLLNLAEQQLVDCSSRYGNNGCGGGTMNAAYQYTRDYGVQPESSYVYTGRVSSCRYNSAKVLFKNRGYVSVPRSYSQLISAVAIQPVTVGVEAYSSTFQMYRGGVVTSNCGTRLDHAITIYAYKTGVATDHWIVRNQWGATWGENGDIRIAMGNQNGGAGLCGINSMASYPTI